MSGPKSAFFMFAFKVGRWFRSRPKAAVTFLVIILLALLSLGGWLAVASLQDSPLKAAHRDFNADLLDSAASHLTAYLQDRPEDQESQFLAARIGRLRGRFFDAEKHLNACKRLGGGDQARDRLQLEWILLRSMGGEHETFAGGLMKCLEQKHPQSRLILEALAYCYMKSLNYPAAAVYLDAWLRKEPDNVRALDWRGWVRENLDYLEGAHEDYERVLALSPHHWRTRVQLVQVLFAEKRVPEALDHLKVLERENSDDPQVIYARALGHEARGQIEEGKKLLDTLLTRQPEDARALHRRGVLEPDPVERERWIRRALASDPSYYEAHYSLYNALLQQGNRAREAAEELKAYTETKKNWSGLRGILQRLAKRPNDPELLAQAGELLLTRNPALGQEFLYNALRLAPEHRRANEVLAQFFEKKKQLDKAERHRKALVRSP